MYKSSSVSRNEAIALSRELRKKINFFTNNPTVDRGHLERYTKMHDDLINLHKLTNNEIENTNLGLAKPKNGFDLPITDESNDPIDIYMSQPSAVEEMEIHRANGMDRDHDNALPFEIGYNRSSGGWDTAGLAAELRQRKQHFASQRHEGVLPGALDDYTDALAMGIDGEQYKEARLLGVPHDYIVQSFTKSLRPHTVQSSYVNSTDPYFNITPAQKALGEFYEDNPFRRQESENTGLEASSGFMPHRVSVIRPVHIVKAYEQGITPDELADAWNNNGFHPLRSFGSRFTHPISKYIATRGMGINHQDAKAVLSSLRHIPLDEFKGHLMLGRKPQDIVNDLNVYKDIELGTGDGKEEIGTTASTKLSNVNEFWRRHRNYDGQSPATSKECYEMSSLARDAFQQTGQGHFHGLARRYQNFGNAIEYANRPQEEEAMDEAQDNPAVRRRNTRNIESHPHFLGWNPDGTPHFV